MKAGTPADLAQVYAGGDMRDPETIEEELVGIGAIADDSTKLERIIAWCASHPDEVPFAIHQLLNGGIRPNG